jgi:hypothetical protein
MNINELSWCQLDSTPVKSDGVVLFLGGETGTREKEVDQFSFQRSGLPIHVFCYLNPQSEMEWSAL